MCQHQFKLSSHDALRKSKGKLLFISEKSISWAERFEKPRKVSKKKKNRERERERERQTGKERERERERERGEEEEDEVAAAKSVHDPDSWIFLQVHTFFFFFQI